MKSSKKKSSLPLSRDEAWELVKKYNKEESNLNHYLETEVIMRALAKKLGEDEDYWGMLGLLHDIDWEITKSDMKYHLTKAPEILKKAGFDDEFIEIVLSHGYGYECAGLKDKKRTKKVEHALACAETITGLIYAYALMRGSIDGMEVRGLKKKFKDKSFAATVDREIIKEYEELGMSLDEFLELSINAITDIAKDIGLGEGKKAEQKEEKIQGKKKRKDKSPLHWADQAARRIIAEKGAETKKIRDFRGFENKVFKQSKISGTTGRGDKKEYIVASGITPSGTLHIGNFREFITGDFVAKALSDKGKKVTYYHYWDDYDVFRKVPSNMPKVDVLKKYLKQALIYVPDVVCDKHKNYSEHNEKEIEEYLPVVGVNPTIFRNSERYLKCEYAEEMKTALENTETIKDIFNKYRTEDLAEDWLPISVYCEKCRLEAEKIKYEGGYNVSYECSCGNKETLDIRKKGLAKLKWRVQWPAWWHNMKVDFESAGKDHFAAGSGIDTGRELQRNIYGTEPPIGFGFGWIGVKSGKQFSSSAGIIFTLKDVLDIYEPAIIRYLFASTRPGAEFAISFDLDVLKYYEDFDKCERIYFKKQKVSSKEYEKQKRIYELSAIKIPKKMPYQPIFRHLVNLLQIHEKDEKKTMNEFKEFLKTKEDKERLKTRMKCALNWLDLYAPDDFKFTVQKEVPKAIKLSAKEKQALHMVAEILKKPVKSDKALHEEFYKICEELKLHADIFFKSAYRVLVHKERGPRLASFILIIGKDKVRKLFEKV